MRPHHEPSISVFRIAFIAFRKRRIKSAQLHLIRLGRRVELMRNQPARSNKRTGVCPCILRRVIRCRETQAASVAAERLSRNNSKPIKCICCCSQKRKEFQHKKRYWIAASASARGRTHAGSASASTADAESGEREKPVALRIASRESRLAEEQARDKSRKQKPLDQQDIVYYSNSSGSSWRGRQVTRFMRTQNDAER